MLSRSVVFVAGTGVGAGTSGGALLTNHSHNLLGALSIAFCLAYKVGLIGIQQSNNKLKSHGRLEKSVFRIGLDALREFSINIE